MDYRWVINEDADASSVDHLSNELGISKILAKILVSRGINSFEIAKKYFSPVIDGLHDPFLMRDMDIATERLHKALRDGENILVYGDYDVDGVSSCSLLYLVLSRLVGSRVNYYIPDRINEGYGLSKESIKRFKEKGVSLIITIDCGVTAVEEVDYANELEVDVIICDHHEPGDVLPAAKAILDPKRRDCNYPFKELAGVGVGFKLLQGLYQRLELNEAELDEYLDIVALGSCADIVPLVDENRILVSHGLQRINHRPRFGVKALLESSGVDRKEITVGLIVFVVAPRINAVGRMGDAKRAVQLLCSTNLQQARVFARELERENKNRRAIDETTFKEALETAEEHFDPENDRALVLYKRDWHPGVIGIVASRIVERYYRPAVMISITDGIGKASARSIADFNIYEALKECESHLEAFGGHKYAAGLTIREENIPAFVKLFKKVASEQIEDTDLIPRMRVDCEIRLKDFDEAFVRRLKLMGPFGPQNLRPVFASFGMRVSNDPTVVGNGHLKISFEQDGVILNAIGFNMGDRLEKLPGKDGYVDCVYVVEENYWNGKRELQIRIKDIK